MCERVGKHLGDAGRLEAGFGAAERRAQARAAGADDDDVVGVIDDRVGLAVDGGRGSAVGLAVAAAMVSGSEAQLQHREDAGERDDDREERVQHQQHDLGAFAVHVVLDDRLHAEPHVDGAGEDQRAAAAARSSGLASACFDGRVVGAGQRRRSARPGTGTRTDVGDGRDALLPEMVGAFLGRAEAADLLQRGSHATSVRHPPRMRRRDPDQRPSAITDTMIVPQDSRSIVLRSKPRPVSQMKWRMPPSMWWMQRPGVAEQHELAGPGCPTSR